mmetsp:Transcript_2335/g.4907  ORF Transcript_2335/g.4907 Transcript_2335/m.4907 type:complete len:706 (-) Transcript_2335:157-2274(-)
METSPLPSRGGSPIVEARTSREDSGGQAHSRGHQSAASRRRGFGIGSLFDYQVKKANSLPFELPVEKYIQETLIGTNGSCSAPGEKRAAMEHRASWCRLRKALSSPNAHEVCQGLFWISVGLLFHTVSDEAVQELREQLAQKWFSVTLEVNDLLLGSPNMQAHKDSLLDSLPLIFVQVVYRLLVDAFEVERTNFMHRSEQLLEKLMIVIQYEVAGFRMDSITLKSQRSKLFKRNVVELPFVNQLESTQNEIRRERIENQSFKGMQPLMFGSDCGIALEETQLAHLMELRATAALPSPQTRRLAVSGHANNLQQTLRTHSTAGLPGMGASRSVKMSGLVDQYQAISQDGEAMLTRHLKELQSVTIDRGSPALTGSRPSTCSSSSSNSVTPSCRMSITSKFRTSTSQEAGGMGRPTKDKKEKEARKRRREEYLLKQLRKPLPRLEDNRMLDTSWVSPVLGQLVPMGEQQPDADCRNLLNKGRREGFRLRMPAAQAKHLPSLVDKSKSEPSLRRPSRAGAMRQNRSMTGTTLPKLTAVGFETFGDSDKGIAGAAPGAAGATSGAAGTGSLAPDKGKTPQIKEVVERPGILPQPITEGATMPTPRKAQPVPLHEPSPSLRADVVRQRLEDEQQAILRNSFETHLKDFNSNTGTKKVKINPHVLEKNEKAYVHRVQALVGDASDLAFRVPKVNLTGKPAGKLPGFGRAVA